MKKLTILSTILIVTLHSAIAQIETFDLSSFKLPYLKLETLNLNFGTNTQNQFDSWRDTSDISYNFNNFSSAFNLGGTYNLYLNTPTQQSDYSISSNLLLYPYSGTKSIYDDESSQLNYSSQTFFQINGSSRNRFYTKPLFFIETGPSIGFNYHRYFEKTINKNEEGATTFEFIDKRNAPSINAAFEFGAGYGRVENVTDAQMALFILKDLKKMNRLDRDPSHQEIFQLAELISQKRVQRFFDNRQKVLAQIKAIDSLLVLMNLTNTMDATYFTTIYDNWLYANNPNRASGFRVSAGPRVAYSTSTQNHFWEQREPIEDVGDNMYNTNQTGLGFWIRALDEKPLNHIWQQTLSADLNYTFFNVNISNNDDPTLKRKHNNFELYLSAMLGYYPNTKTYIDFGIGSGWYSSSTERNFYLADSDYDDDRLKFLRIFAGPTVNGYYYFSPQLRFSFNGYINYNFYSTDNFGLISPPGGFGFAYISANRVNLFINASIRYAIF